MTMVALVIIGLLAPFVLFDLVARPTIRRLALRNVARRPGEAALVVVGSLLATALITASFIIGNSFASSIRNLAIDRWGPTDELVIVGGPHEVGPATEAIAALPTDLIDGALGTTYLDVAIGSTGPDRQVAPEVRLLELDPAAAATFTDDPLAVAGTTEGTLLAPGQLVINEVIAAELDVAPGDQVEIFVDGSPIGFEVASIRPAQGLNGFGEMLAPPGAVTDHLTDPQAVATAAVLVSNTGDVFSGADLSAEAVAAIEAALGDEAEVIPVKERLLADAVSEGAEMQELFGTIGGFSVAAGILLVVNLFVMLAGERKSEMGTLRATGLRRGHLVRALNMEGAVYGVLAAVSGVVVGIGVAAVVMSMAASLLDDGTFTVRLDVVPTSLLSGAVIGLMVSQLTVLATAWRSTRLNIVRAIRDLPEPPSIRGTRRQTVLGLAGLVGGAAAFALAGTSAPLVAMAAPVVILVSAVPLVGRIVPRRAALVVACSAGLAWVAAVFGLMPETMDNPEIYLFLAQGVLLVGLATVIAAALDRAWLAGAAALSRGGISSRLGMAEPLARPVRTALLVAMYALVIFTLTFMAVMNAVFQAQSPEFAVQAGGGYDLFVDTNPSSGLTADDLRANPELAHVAPIVRGVIRGRVDPEVDDSWGSRASGIDSSLLEGTPPALTRRADTFASDDEAWAAVATPGERHLIIDADWDLAPGDTFHVEGAAGELIPYTIAGTTEQGWIAGAGFMVNASELRQIVGDELPATRFYATVAGGAEADDVAARLTNEGLEQSIDARTFLAEAEAETVEQEGFLNLLRAYLGLGLLIGIAGLGVVLVRAVRERRRQFGVMRALGIAAPVIRRAFIIEASFVAVQGVTLGIGLGLLSSWQTLTRSTAFEAGLSFTVPVLVLAVLGALCLVASLAMAAIPAVRAGRTAPALALRVAT